VSQLSLTSVYASDAGVIPVSNFLCKYCVIYMLIVSLTFMQAFLKTENVKMDASRLRIPGSVQKSVRIIHSNKTLISGNDLRLSARSCGFDCGCGCNCYRSVTAAHTALPRGRIGGSFPIW
jgi:hypothetical protein